MQSLIDDEHSSTYTVRDRYGNDTDTPYNIPQNSPISLLVDDQPRSPTSPGIEMSSILEDEDGNSVDLSFLKGKLVRP
jgi:hypothetical protein